MVFKSSSASSVTLAATLRVSQEQQQVYQQKLEELQSTFDQKLEDKVSEIKGLVNNISQLVNEHKQQSDAQVKNLQSLEQSLQEKELAILTLEEQKKEFQEEIHTLQKKLKDEENRQIKLPYEITYFNFKEHKSKDLRIDGPKKYTHPKGYRYQISIRPNGSLHAIGYGTHVSVKVYAIASEHDTRLKFPARFTITLELLNQHRDQDHYRRDIRCEVKDDGGLARIASVDYKGIGFDRTYISHADLEWNADKQTQYLKNDCLKFRVVDVAMHK